MTLNDAILEATGGPTVNDGLLAFFIAGGATGPTLPDAERQWLCLKLGVPVSVNATNQDLWMQHLASYPGALNDKLFQFWSTPQSLTAQVQALFAKYSAAGGMWDFTDMATLFQDSARTVPVTAASQPVGGVNDISGLHSVLAQPTSVKRPLFNGGAGAVFDGVDDSLAATGLTLPYAQADGFTLAASTSAAQTGQIGAGLLTVAAGATEAGQTTYFESRVRTDALGQALVYIRADASLTPTVPNTNTPNGSRPVSTMYAQISWAESDVVRVQINDEPVVSSTSYTGDSSATYKQIRVGGTNQVAVQTACVIRRAIVLNKTISSDDRALVRAWLMEGA